MYRLRSAAATLILLAALFGAAVPIQARIMVVPTADVLNDGTIELRLYNHRGRTYLSGAAGMFGTLQVEATGIFSADTVVRSALQLALVKEQQDLPGLAVGVEFDDSVLGFYGVVSKQLGLAGLRGHVAWGSGRFSKGMVGVSYVVNPVQVNSNSPIITVGAEYDGNGFNGGISAHFTPNLSAHVYLSDFQSLGAGLKYRFAF